MSWFTEETLCLDCIAKEGILKSKLKNPGSYEGCGYIPCLGYDDDREEAEIS